MTAEITYYIHPLFKPPRATRRLQGPRAAAFSCPPEPCPTFATLASPLSILPHLSFPALPRQPNLTHSTETLARSPKEELLFGGRPYFSIYTGPDWSSTGWQSLGMYLRFCCARRETRLPTREKPNAHSILLQRRGNFWSPGSPPRAWAMERCGHRHPKFSGQCCCCVLRAGDGCRGRRAGCPISRSTSREPVQSSRCSAAICFSVHSGHEFVRHGLCFLREQ